MKQANQIRPYADWFWKPTRNATAVPINAKGVQGKFKKVNPSTL